MVKRDSTIEISGEVIISATRKFAPRRKGSSRIVVPSEMVASWFRRPIELLDRIGETEVEFRMIRDNATGTRYLLLELQP